MWGFDYKGQERSVDTHIKILRKALGPYQKGIKTVIKQGYCFETKVFENGCFLRALSIVLLLGMFYLAFKNRKFKRLLLIESVLIIVFIIGRQMYTSNLNTMDTVMWSLASDVTNQMITQSDKNIENNMHDILSTIYDGNGLILNKI